MILKRLSHGAAVLAIGSALSVGSAQAVTLTYATWQPEASEDLHAVSLHWLADQLEKRTNGEHSLQIFWGGTLAGISEIGDAVENGLADMGDLVVPYFPDQFIVNNAIGFFWPQPHSPLELAELMQEFHAEIPQFGSELARYNMRLIGLRPLGYYGMICREPIREMADFQGKRIRSYGVALPAAIQAIGGVPVSMSTVETYEGLQRGVIDCTPIEPVIARGWRYDEVARYYIDVPLGASWGQFIVINESSYESLPDDLRQVLDELGADYHRYFTDEQQRLTEETLAAWNESEDFEVITIAPDEFLAMTENSEFVDEARRQWIDRATDLGVPADDIAARMSFE